MKTYIAGLFLLLLLISGCNTEKPPESTNKGRITHIVLCWLKEPGNVSHCDKIIAATESFQEIPGVLEVRVGRVVHSDRKIVDDSFDVGISFTFKNAEDMKAYLDHPLHKAAKKETLVPLVEIIIVYDFVE